jgi:hypothetical protein
MFETRMKEVEMYSDIKFDDFDPIFIKKSYQLNLFI